MAQKLRVALIVDHPLRDLAGLSMVALELAERGVDCYLVPMQFQMRDLFALRPDFVVLNYIRNNNAALIDGLIEAGIDYGVLDTEGGFYGDLKKYGQTLGENKSHWAHMAKFFVWGEKMRKYLVDEVGLPNSKMIVTGQPRFDLYSPQYQPVLKSLLPDSWKKNPKPLVLLNTKVSVANPRFVTREKEIELYTKVLKIPMDEVMRHLRLGEEAVKGTCDIAGSLSTRFPEIELMIRPHPHERLETYVEGTNGAANIHVACEGGVGSWIVRSKALIHRHCTTAIEAALAGVPVLAPQWLASSAFVPDGEAVSLPSHSMDELKEHVDASLRGTVAMPASAQGALERLTDDWLHRVDGRTAARVADAIIAVTPTHRRVDERKSRNLLYRAYENRTSVAGQVFHYGNLVAQATTFRKPIWLAETYRRAKWQAGAKGFKGTDVESFIRLIDERQVAAVHSANDEATDGYPIASIRVSAKA